MDTAPVFDQRPGIFEATRWSRPGGLKIVGVAQQAEPAGWHVIVSLFDEVGPLYQCGLTLDEARRLHDELGEAIEILEGRA